MRGLWGKNWEHRNGTILLTKKRGVGWLGSGEGEEGQEEVGSQSAGGGAVAAGLHGGGHDTEEETGITGGRRPRAESHGSRRRKSCSSQIGRAHV